MDPVVFRAPRNRGHLIQESLAHLHHPPVLLPVVHLEPDLTELFGQSVSLAGDLSGPLDILIRFEQDPHALLVILGEELLETSYVLTITILKED